MSIQQGVILAAGKGSRLHPITVERSKAMLPVLGKPIVERVMEDMADNGIQDFVLVVSPDDDELVRYFQDESLLRVKVQFSYQEKRVGMADALRQAVPFIRGDFLLSACDNLISAEHIGRMLAAWETDPQPDGVLTLMKVEPERLGSVGIVEMRGQWITRIVEKPAPEEAKTDTSSLPLYAFSPVILDFLSDIPLSPRGEYELQDAIQMLINRQGRVRGVFASHRLTLTTAADLLEINRRYLNSDEKHPQTSAEQVGLGTRMISPFYIESGVVIGKDCTIGPNVYIERDCHIGDGVILQDAVVLRESYISSGEVIVDEVVS